MEKTLSRRDALKILAAATGGIALSTLPVWKRPFVGVGALPAFAQTSLGTGDFQATLTWNTGTRNPGDTGPQVDIDLHVFEPDGTHVYWDNQHGVTANQDVDNTWGFGPENIFVAPGHAAAGIYEVWINYYSGDLATIATITVRVFANTSHEHSQTFTRNLPGPGDEGDCGVKVANVTFPAGTIVEQTGTDCGNSKFGAKKK